MAARIRIFPSRVEAEKALSLNIPRKVIVANQIICMVRTEKGIFALKDACPHQRASLSEGKINSFDEIICPLHEYRFNLIHGREASQQCGDAEIYHVDIDIQGIYLVI